MDGLHVHYVHLETESRVNGGRRPSAAVYQPLLYLHRVSASVHRVLGAVGGRAPPVEVQLDGVVHVQEAAATHRHAAPDVQNDWQPKQMDTK